MGSTKGKFLQVDPQDAKLLCALGDLTSDISHYETAWQRSNGRSSRAQRSLAKHWMTKSNFEEVLLSAKCYRLAVRLAERGRRLCQAAKLLDLEKVIVGLNSLRAKGKCSGNAVCPALWPSVVTCYK